MFNIDNNNELNQLLESIDGELSSDERLNDAIVKNLIIINNTV